MKLTRTGVSPGALVLTWNLKQIYANFAQGPEWKIAIKLIATFNELHTLRNFVCSLSNIDILNTAWKLTFLDLQFPISEPLLCFATPEPVTFFNILSSYDQAPLRAAIKMADPEHDEFWQSRIVSTRHLIRCQYYTLESHGTNWFFWYEKPQQHGRILQISGGENFGESIVNVTHYWS